MSIVKNHIKQSSTTISTDFNFPIVNDVQSIELKNKTRLNEDGITMWQGDRDGGDNRSKVLEDILNYTIDIQSSKKA